MIPSISIPVNKKNDIIICTLAIGESHVAMMKIMVPTLEYYAKMHNIDCFINEQTVGFDPSRPPSWDKIILMKHMLNYYNTVIWIDADAIICNPIYDIRNDIDVNYPIQLVTHFGIKPLFPNGGVWIVQRDPRSLELLEAIWSQEQLINHPWWEQAALLTLLGYEPKYIGKRKVRYHGPTKFSSWVGPLDLKWNSRPSEFDIAENPAIMHYVFIPHHIRIEKMKEQYQNFLKVTKVIKFVARLGAKYKDKKPSIILFKATTKGKKVHRFIYKDETHYLKMIRGAYKRRQIDGAIISKNFTDKKYVISYLQEQGMKINRHLFILDSH